jgi:hypothetical protein
MSTPSIFEYLPKQASAAIWKMAEADKALPERPIAHGLKTVGSSLAWMGLGTLAGYGGGALLGKAVKGLTGKKIPPEALQLPASLAGAGMGIAYKNYKDKELEELHRAVQGYRNRAKGSVSGQ